MDSEPDMIQLPLTWIGLDETPIVSASHFISQFHEDLFVVSFGMVSPPVLLGTPEERAEQARAIDYVPVRPVARLGLTRATMERLIGILNENLGRFDEQGDKGRV